MIGYGEEQGWEAALFDHYQAMVTAMAAKVRSGATSAQRDEHTGGSTYHFDLYPGHPLEQEVLGLLTEIRERVSALRAKVNADGGADVSSSYKVVFYAGQHVIAGEEELEETEP